MKQIDLRRSPPVVIVGTGGSGTRVVNQILQISRFFIGTNLNRALDNQDFGFLLAGRVDWMRRYFPFDGRDGNAEKYLSVFEKVFFKKPLAPVDFLRLGQVFLEYFSGSSRK